jgi:hypothetical protein
MQKSVLLASLIGASLVMSGCGSSSSDGESRLETQQMLDKANYQGVIDKLENNLTKTAEQNLALAAAYMGRAGLSLSDLIKVVGDSGDNDDAFGSFIGSVDSATKDSKTPLADLNKATSYYKTIVGNKCDDDTVTLTDTQKDICIYKGLSQTMGAATAMNYISEDISSVFSENSNESDNKLNASTCAMQYAIDGNDANIDKTICTITDNNKTLTFASEVTYKQIFVTVNGSSYEYLLTQSTPASTAVTKGYCSLTSFKPRVEDTNSSEYEATFHVCPVTEDKNTKEITTGAVIANALNNGIDSIGVAADDEMKKDIDEFKKEVLASSGKGADDEITEEDIIKYLNKNNNEE